VQVVNVSALDARFEAGSVVGPAELVTTGLATANAGAIKVLAKGEVSKNLTVRAHEFSEAARRKIESAGGAIEVLERAE
jgi:large subunit ribosomal protein L15